MDPRENLGRILMLACMPVLAVGLFHLGLLGSSAATAAGSGATAKASTLMASVEPPPGRAAHDRGRMHGECMVLDSRIQSPWGECIYGNPGSDTHVVLFGDSQALHWGPTLIQIAEERDWRLTALMRQGCTVAQVVYEPRCDRWRRNALRRIVRVERPDLVVVSTGTTRRYKVMRGGRRLDPPSSYPHLRRGMRVTLWRLVRTGARVALIRDQHRAVPHPPSCLLDNPNRHPNRACRFRPTSRLKQQNWDYRAGRRNPGVRVIDPNPMLCPERTACPVVRDGILMYRDSYHLTATFARTLAPWLSDQLPQAEKWK